MVDHWLECLARHDVLFRKEGVSVLTQVFVYSADTVSWTTDSCRCRCSLCTPHACCYQQAAHIPWLSVLDKCLVCDIFVLKQQTSSRKTKTTFWKRSMGTLFMESLKRLEADMATKTRNPLSLLQLTMRFLTFLSNVFSLKCDIIDTCYLAFMKQHTSLLRMVIRLKLSDCELPVTLRQKLRNEVSSFTNLLGPWIQLGSTLDKFVHGLAFSIAVSWSYFLTHAPLQ